MKLHQILYTLPVMLMGVSPSMAQEEASGSLALEEIVVTALKRATNIQDTPLSISAVSGDMLERIGADDIVDYFATVPGLSIVDQGPGERRLVIRGINGVGEAQVGLYYDETYVTGAPGAEADSGARQPDFKLIDIARVEVLKGPQGTLYGSGSVGGTVRVITNKPNVDEFEVFAEGDLSTTTGGGEGWGLNAMANAPLVEGKLGMRVVGYYRDEDGFIDNVPLNTENINDEKTWGGRVALRLQAAENLTIDAKVMLQRTDSGGRPEFFPSIGDLQTDRVTQEFLIDDSEIYNLTVDWEFDDFQLVASTSYYERFVEFNFDTTPFIAGFDNAGICGLRAEHACSDGELAAHSDYINGLLPATVKQPQNVNNWTNELRVNSTGEGPLYWTLGLFTESRESDLKSQVLAATPDGLAREPFEYIFFREATEKVDQLSLFGEVTYDVTEDLSITGGMRWYDYDKTNTGKTNVGFALVNAPAGPAPDGDASQKGTIFKGNISYHVNDDVLLYGTVVEGFRLGGANQSVFVEVPAQFGPDSVTNYEIGAKTNFMDNRIKLNVALFKMVWDNMQVGGTTPDGAFAFIGNAGKAAVDGIEVEFDAQATDRLLISGGMTIQNARLTEDQIDENGDFEAPGVKGDRIPRVPRFMANLAVDYGWTMSDDMEGFARLDYNYMGSRNSTLSTTDEFFLNIEDYSMFNASVGITTDGWRASLYAKNLFNKRAQSNRGNDDFTAQSIFTMRPQTFGLKVRRDF
ncbi:TonB-dependent receptor [Paremcibacter congregatus]|uniref:Ligand-gated channel protein n=1 Tax=Paremcibacter congregatus TaxID=2043170 RepID=A0A2G4YP81_9PROT|nr:TonB-dependent receptor [Paremcibacter congregatus]PHZ84113.1 ligand-gated channel protein [Paremcibacter congregatus]QDE25828.1 TonB-dependent receptor [Paremcibacter congregatus]